jgi:glycosyltransferase involved in cell wall biosynthesis
MLSFEPGEIQRYPWSSRARLRLEILKFVQLRRLKRSKLAVFLSEHARTVIGRYTELQRTVIIPHGIDPAFRAVSLNRRPWPIEGPIRCLYVSNAAPYKHQWHVVEAVARLRQTSTHDIRLRLVGGGRGPSLERLLKAVDQFDPHHKFVELIDFAPHASIPNELATADLFLFASSCENLPITLLEAMASGIAICSSDRGPMPEVLGPDADYFDPEAPAKIADGLRTMIEDPVRREALRASSLVRSASYTWEACAEKTWAALATIARGKS